MAAFDLSDLFGCSDGYDLTTAVAAFRPDVDDMVGGFHHVQIVFDHHDGIALIDQFMQHFQQLAYIFEMQTRGRFVQI